jgi:DNA-binding transcriptional ArsR family regulator
MTKEKSPILNGAQPVATVELGEAVANVCRLEMLALLMQFEYLPATTLASAVRMSAQATRFHLRKLEATGIVRAVPCGRHRYYRISTPEIAAVIEDLCRITRLPAKIVRDASTDQAFIEARYCYNHLAGRWAVQIARFLLDRNIVVGDTSDCRLTASGERFFRNFGIDIDALQRSQGFARWCIDWTERRAHLGGKLGAALAESLIARGWIERIAGRRAVTITLRGRYELTRLLSDVEQSDASHRDAHSSSVLLTQRKARGS